MNKLFYTFYFCIFTSQALADSPLIVKIFDGLQEVSSICRESNKTLSQINECEKSTKKGKNYDVYANTKTKKIIGKLEIIPAMSGGFDFYYSGNGRNKENFNLTNIISDCKKDNYTPEFLVSKRNDGDYILLPSGPWGAEAWIKENHSDLFQSSILFDFKNLKAGHFSRDQKTLTFTGIDKTLLNHDGDASDDEDLEKARKIIKFDESEMWNPKGRFIPYRSCGTY